MLILGIVIAIVIFVVVGIIDVCDDYDIQSISASGSLLLFGACLIGMFICFHQLGQAKIIDEKIIMYQEENKQIESQIDSLVKEYMQYEGNTLKEFASDSSITLVTIYPDLKSDELVKNQINTYTENNNKIKELKESKLEYRLAKWGLYFGN